MYRLVTASAVLAAMIKRNWTNRDNHIHQLQTPQPTYPMHKSETKIDFSAKKRRTWLAEIVRKTRDDKITTPCTHTYSIPNYTRARENIQTNINQSPSIFDFF